MTDKKETGSDMKYFSVGLCFKPAEQYHYRVIALPSSDMHGTNHCRTYNESAVIHHCRWWSQPPVIGSVIARCLASRQFSSSAPYHLAVISSRYRPSITDND